MNILTMHRISNGLKSRSFGMCILFYRATPCNESYGLWPQLELIVFMEGSLFDMKSFMSEIVFNNCLKFRH